MLYKTTMQKWKHKSADEVAIEWFKEESGIDVINFIEKNENTGELFYYKDPSIMPEELDI